MKSALSIIQALLLILLFAWQPVYGWDCSITLDGPTWVKIDHTINLSASGLPSGGQYYWSSSPYLVPNGSSATLTGFKPTYSDYIRVTVSYLSPTGGHCSDTKWVYAHLGDCQVALDGVSVAPVGAPTLIAASGQPDGGTCAWLSPTGLLDQGLTAQYTAQASGLQSFKAEYTTPSEDTCTATHDTTFVKVGSIVSPYACVNSGTTLDKSSFSITTEPSGYVDNFFFSLDISPLTLTTLSQSSAETITASITPESTLDDAKTTILVVNKDHKQKISLDFKIPNYVNDALKLIGVGEDLDLKLEGGFSRFIECCAGVSTKNSVSGSTTIGLYANAGPYTIVGIPLPPVIKKYVTLDALAVSVSGSGSATLKGDYSGCDDATRWSGSGDLKTGIDLGGEVKAKSPSETLVIKGSLKGKTGVTETIKVESPNIALSGKWDGLTVEGQVKLTYRTLKLVEEPVSVSILKERPIPQVAIELPPLK